MKKKIKYIMQVIYQAFWDNLHSDYNTKKYLKNQADFLLWCQTLSTVQPLNEHKYPQSKPSQVNTTLSHFLGPNTLY